MESNSTFLVERFKIRKMNRSSSPKLKDLLNTKIVLVQAINRSGVYIIPLKKDNKDFLYIGMTMRKFRDRIKEQEIDIRLNRLHTALARLDQIQPKKDFNKSKIIFGASRGGFMK